MQHDVRRERLVFVRGQVVELKIPSGRSRRDVQRDTRIFVQLKVLLWTLLESRIVRAVWSYLALSQDSFGSQHLVNERQIGQGLRDLAK